MNQPSLKLIQQQIVRHHEKYLPENVSGNKAFSAILNFAIHPYALGDLLTWNLKCCVLAKMQGYEYVDIYIVVDPKRPSMLLQPFVTSENYNRYFIKFYPIFYFNPMLRNIHIFRDMHVFSDYLQANFTKGTQIYPTRDVYNQHLEQGQDSYASTHSEINEFYYKCGWIPTFKVPQGINVREDLEHLGFSQRNFFVAVHLRQRRNELHGDFLDPLRDSNINPWLKLFTYVNNKFPEVKFFLLGEKHEMAEEVLALPNVFYLKSFGMDIVHELALIHEADLFLGANSGPATMAMFSNTPYILFYQPRSAATTSYCFGVPVGSEKLPFARQEQWLKWTYDNVETLVESFFRIYKKLTNQ